MENQGAAWGARKEVIRKAVFVLNEIHESLCLRSMGQGGIQAKVRFNEFHLDVDVEYAGKPLEFPAERPAIDPNATEDAELQKFSGFLIRKQADQITSETKNGICRIHLGYEH